MAAAFTFRTIEVSKALFDQQDAASPRFSTAPASTSRLSELQNDALRADSFSLSSSPQSVCCTKRRTDVPAQEGTTLSLSSLPASVRSQRRDQRILNTYLEIDSESKGFIDHDDLSRFARANGLPEEYVAPFMDAVLEGKHPNSPISLERFQRFVGAREASLQQAFERLDSNKDGRLTPRQVAAGLANICFNCPFSRCSYKCTPAAVRRLLNQHSDLSSEQQGSMGLKDFRRLFFLLPRSEMLVDYWLKASAPALCDTGGCVVVRDVAEAKGAPWGHLAAGAVAGAASRTATAPLETLRLQAMTGAAVMEGGPLQAAKRVIASSGWKGLYKGNGLNVLRAAPQKALDFFAFDIYKGLLSPSFGANLFTTFVAAGMAGATSTAVLHPLEVLRSRITCDVTGRYSGLASAAREVVRSEGVRALYSGFQPSILAILPEAMITYGMFDGLKRGYARLKGQEETGVLPSIACGVISAFTGQMVAFPLEAVARRLQVQSQAAKAIGVTAIIQQILKREGVRGLYRGSGAAVLRVLPMALVSFSTYEVVRLWITRMEEAKAYRKVEVLADSLGSDKMRQGWEDEELLLKEGAF